MSVYSKSRYLENNPAIGGSWEDFEKTRFSKDVIEISKFKVAIIGTIKKAREEKGITQKQLEELTGIKQPIIARIENGNSNPQIDTLIKILVALDMRIEIKNLDNVEE